MAVCVLELTIVIHLQYTGGVPLNAYTALLISLLLFIWLLKCLEKVFKTASSAPHLSHVMLIKLFRDGFHCAGKYRAVVLLRKSV